MYMYICTYMNMHMHYDSTISILEDLQNVVS